MCSIALTSTRTWCCFQLFICSLAFATFTVDFRLPQSRLQLSFILLLTTITFKFVVSQTLPRISYLTYLVCKLGGLTTSLPFTFQLFICSLTFSTFVVDLRRPQNRLQLSFILLLTTITFKFVVSQTLPKIPYLTYLVGGCSSCWIPLNARLV